MTGKEPLISSGLNGVVNHSMSPPGPEKEDIHLITIVIWLTFWLKIFTENCNKCLLRLRLKDDLANFERLKKWIKFYYRKRTKTNWRSI